VSEWARVTSGDLNLLLKISSPVFKRSVRFMDVAGDAGGEEVFDMIVLRPIQANRLPSIHAILADDILDLSEHCNNVIGMPLLTKFTATVGAPTSEHLFYRSPL
jgi:hypothetical protein